MPHRISRIPIWNVIRWRPAGSRPPKRKVGGTSRAARRRPARSSVDRGFGPHE